MKTLKEVKYMKPLISSNKGQMSVGIGILLLAVAGVGFFAYNLGQGGGKLSITGESEEQTLTIAQGGSGCPDTLITTFQGDVLNDLSTSADYVGLTTYLIPKNADGSLDFSARTTYTASTSATRSTAVSLQCGREYVWSGVVQNDTAGSFEAIELGKLSGSTTSAIAKTQKQSAVKVKAYDNVNKAFIYDSADADNSDFEALGTTFKSTTDNATATALGDGDQIDWSFIHQATTADTQFGDLNTYVAVDADKTDYAEPSLFFNGVALADVRDQLSSDDVATISGYEYIFELPRAVSDRPEDLRLVVESKSGVNPDVDIKLRFLAESQYVLQDGVTIGSNIFKDSDSSELYETTAQTITLDIS